MLTVYICFLAGGAVIPLFNSIMGFLSHGFDTHMDGDMSSGADLHSHIGFEHDISGHLADGHDIAGHIGGDGDTGTNMDSMDAGTGSVFSLGLLPTSLLSLSAFAVTFGASGALMTIGNLMFILTLVLAAVIGYISLVIVQTIINTLKKAQTVNGCVDEQELLLYDGRIVDTILPGQYGTVSFVTLHKERVSYPAKCSDKSLKLETGKIVKVKEFTNGIFIVEPKNKYE